MRKIKFKISKSNKKWKVNIRERDFINEILEKNWIGKEDIRKSLIIFRLLEGHSTKAKRIRGARTVIRNLKSGGFYEGNRLAVGEDFEKYQGVEFGLILNGAKGCIQRV